MKPDADPIEKANVLAAAASKAKDATLRAIYVAEARGVLDVAAARLEAARELVEAQEAELARLAARR